jgi:hypothetical protein
MASTRKTFLIGAVTALEAGCLLGVACLGRGMLPLERASATPEPVPRDTVSWETLTWPTEVAQTDLETAKAEAQRTPGCAAIPEADADERAPSGTATSRAPRKESEFYAAFLTIAARGPEALERAARTALAEDGPDCHKVAALRALRDAGCARTDDILVAVIEGLPDASGPRGESVPRFALRSLVERAACDEGARSALDRIAWGGRMPAGSALRAAAAAALAATATEDEIWAVAARLRSEADPLTLAGAVEALSRNPAAAAADAALESLGVEPPVRKDVPERQE